MCTVSLIPTGDSNFILTSNRDEAPNRKTLKPDYYTLEGQRLLYPKDQLAGGTWIGLSDRCRLICLLNGGFSVHERQASYRLSRGVVVKDLLVAPDFKEAITNYNLINVEPFTIVLVSWRKKLEFYEFVWDGKEKHFKSLPLEPSMWSSSSLYSQTMKNERQEWFQEFKDKHEFTMNAAMTFHTSAGKNNLDYGLIMDREYVKTTSITQIEKQSNNLKMHYKNLKDGTETEKSFSCVNTKE